MDANGLKFWLLADDGHWHLAGDPPGLEYDNQRRGLRLSRQRRDLDLAEDEGIAKKRLDTVPRTRDAFGNRAWWDPALRSILAEGVSDVPQVIYDIQGEEEVTDLALGDDGVLYLAVGGTVVMHDRRQRWADATLSTEGFSAWRLATAPGGGAWVLDRDNRRLARLRGYPLSSRAYKPYRPDVVRPCSENADPPRLDLLSAVSWPAQETPVALACSLSGRLICLSWVSQSEAVIRELTGELEPELELSAPVTLVGSSSPYSLAWLDDQQAVVLVCGEGANGDPLPPVTEARAYSVVPGSRRYPSGDLYPLKRDFDHGPFMHGLDYPPHYNGGYDLRLMSVATTDELVGEGQSLVIVALVSTALHIRIFDASGEKVVDKAESELTSGDALTKLKQLLVSDPDERSLRDRHEIIGYATSSAGLTRYGYRTSHPLHRLSYVLHARRGEAYNIGLHNQLDSGQLDSVWHRLYMEASIPPGCGIRVWLAASNRMEDHIHGTGIAWFEHRFGEGYREGGRSEIPVGAWSPLPSELPYHPGLMPCSPEAGRKGLFSVLIQRTGLKVRSLRGRYLYLRVELIGPGNATPELFAIRAYASRFSYVEHYLPKLYWETTFAPEADLPGNATGADFLERFIGNIEGLMTNLEDRVAYSDLVTRPRTAPAEALEWLADWVGFQLEPGWSELQRRRFLECSAELYRWHGTLRGLNLALEIATGGGVSGGEVLVLEDYRLRRTFATILGADLDDDQDPLTLGGIETGNSFLGDTLFLGDEQRREFLALFSADLKLSRDERKAVEAFFERLAYRVSILVRQGTDQQDLDIIRSIAEREVPAHVQFRILTTSAPLLVGVSSLVGVDTYLTKRPLPRPARVQGSHVGRGDYVMGPAALDSRLEGIGSGRPVLPGQAPIA
jgi:phage tail-like protein